LGRITWQRADELLPWRRRFVPRLRQKLYDTRHRLYISPDFRRWMAEIGLPVPVLESLGVAPHLSGGNASIRMLFIEECGGFDERFFTFHDRELAYRILSHGGVIAYNPGMMIEHDHDPSIVRVLRRSAASVPYAQLLRQMYENEPWWNIEGRSQRWSNEGTLPLDDPLTPTEQAFMTLQDGVKRASGAWLRMTSLATGNAR
jgi:GT2 family glycosyltransferase